MSSSGILIPDSAVEKTQIAEVINVGDGVTGYKQLEKVIYKPYSTTDIKLNGEEFFLIAEDDVLGVVVDVEASN